MEFRKMVTITLYTRQQKRHWCIEQFFGLCGRGRGWDDLGEWHWNMYNIIYETSRQSRFNAWYGMLGAGALGQHRGMVWGGRREEGSGWGTHVYLWRIHFDIWQNQYNIVKLKNKRKRKISRDDNGDGCTTMWVCLMSLDAVLKSSENGQFYTGCILPPPSQQQKQWSKAKGNFTKAVEMYQSINGKSFLYTIPPSHSKFSCKEHEMLNGPF